MSLRRLLVLPSVALLLLAVQAEAPVARASNVPAPGWGETAALVLLDRASNAARATRYQGTQFVSSWGPSGTTTFIAELEHVPGQGTAVRVEGTPHAPGGAMFAADSDHGGGLAGPTGGTLSLLAGTYDVSLAGYDEVAGRRTHVVVALRDDRSVAARFWLDERTGLMLRRQVFDSSGRTVRASAYVQIHMGDGPVPLASAPRLPQPWSRQLDEAGLEHLRAHGWHCPYDMPDRLTLYDVRSQRDEHGLVLHLSYSDGLSTVSVFQQRGRLEDGPRGYRTVHVAGAAVLLREGVPRRVVWSADGTVYTVLADAPWEMVKDVVASLPHEQQGSGSVDRVRRGLGRVVSWLNPFG